MCILWYSTSIHNVMLLVLSLLGFLCVVNIDTWVKHIFGSFACFISSSLSSLSVSPICRKQ